MALNSCPKRRTRV